MDLGLISVRYARALLKASDEAHLSANVYKDMQTLAESYIRVPELRFTIDNPMLSKDKKAILLKAAAGQKDCCTLTETFLKLVLKEDRESMIQFMANSFITLYRRQNNLIRAKLVTATNVSPVTEKKLRQLVESNTSGNVEFETEVKPDILGGFVLQYDTYRMDASVKTKLNSILSHLK